MSQAADAAMRLFLARLTDRSVLSEEERSALLALPGEESDYRANQDIVRLGERVHAACLVVEGLVARFAQTAAGDRQIIALHIPGDAADLHSVVSPQVVAPLQALAPTRIRRIRHNLLVRLATDYPAIAHAFWRDAVVDGGIVGETVLTLGRRRAAARLAHLLCEMTVRYERIGARREAGIDFPITQMQLGDALGLTPIHVNRMVRELREKGLATLAKGKLVVQDWEGLVDLADFDAAYLQFERIDRHA